jgi:hypothetical protein
MVWVSICYVACAIMNIVTHDMLQDTFVAITLESGTYIKKEVYHLFPCHTRRQVDIVITRDSFQTLAVVVIADLTCPNLVQCASTMTTHASTTVAQDKAQSYIE